MESVLRTGHAFFVSVTVLITLVGVFFRMEFNRRVMSEQDIYHVMSCD